MQLASVNQEIDQDERRHRDGSPVTAMPITSALGTADLRFIYPIIDGIYCLLPGLAIVRSSETAAAAALEHDKQVVQAFYDDYGWQRHQSGKYNDTQLFTVDTPAASAYARTCNQRVGGRLKGGEFLLDAASGAIPIASYLPFSDGYRKRVCVDLSVVALREARSKLGPDRGVYVLGDITCLPIQDGVIDDAVSLHTIYHVPQALQTQAIDELVRVLKPSGKLIVVYTWASCAAMTLARGISAMAARLPLLARSPAPVFDWSSLPPLYYHPQDRTWFTTIKSRHSAKLRLWSAIDLPFQQRLFGPGIGGRLAAALVTLAEFALEPILSRHGQYPLFVITKPRCACSKP